jgi:hypothetical protein
MRVWYDEETRAVTAGGRNYYYEFAELTAEDIVGATVERLRKGGKPLAIRLADDRVVEEVWPAPAGPRYPGE